MLAMWMKMLYNGWLCDRKRWSESSIDSDWLLNGWDGSIPLGTASFVPQENTNLLTVWSMTWWLNIFVLMDFDTKHTDNKIWPIFRISEILTKTKKRVKQSRVEEPESRQRSCTRRKVLVRQHGGLCTYWCDETWWWWWWPNKLDQ